MDPYRLYHALDEQYRPIEGGQDDARPPNPARWRYLIYGFASLAQDEEAQMISGAQARRQGME